MFEQFYLPLVSWWNLNQLVDRMWCYLNLPPLIVSKDPCWATVRQSWNRKHFFFHLNLSNKGYKLANKCPIWYCLLGWEMDWHVFRQNVEKLKEVSIQKKFPKVSHFVSSQIMRFRAIFSSFIIITNLIITFLTGLYCYLIE
jgi:hypothetical protein